MLKSVVYYRDRRGRYPVLEFINSLSCHEQAKVMAYISELRAQGHNLRRPLAGYVTAGLYELRPRDTRIFYFFYLGESAVLLHAIRKKAARLPKGDILLALKRKAEV